MGCLIIGGSFALQNGLGLKLDNKNSFKHLDKSLKQLKTVHPP